MECALSESANSDLISQFWQQWTEHQGQLYRCCLKLMNSNPTDAEDALSRAMLKAWEKVQKFQGKITNFKPWLIQLTRNLCIDIIRERSRGAAGVHSIEWVGDTEEMGIASTVASPEHFLEREEDVNEIRQAIADLPERLRETFILHFYQELPHAEIAEQQGISYQNACKRISLARKQLKDRLSGYFQGSESEVSVTAVASRKFSTPGEYGEKQERIESEEKKGLEMVTVSPSPHLPIPRSFEEVVEAEKQECVDSSVESGDNVGQTIQERATISLEVEGYRVVEAEKQECVESAVESREQVNQKIQETATELTEVECVEVVEAEKDGCVESSVKSKDNRCLQKINNFIKPFLGTASKSHQKKSLACCLSRERSRWLRPSVWL